VHLISVVGRCKVIIREFLDDFPKWVPSVDLRRLVSLVLGKPAGEPRCKHPNPPCLIS
jgi:hypothetical protein